MSLSCYNHRTSLVHGSNKQYVICVVHNGFMFNKHFRTSKATFEMLCKCIGSVLGIHIKYSWSLERPGEKNKIKNNGSSLLAKSEIFHAFNAIK